MFNTILNWPTLNYLQTRHLDTTVRDVSVFIDTWLWLQAIDVFPYGIETNVFLYRSCPFHLLPALRTQRFDLLGPKGAKGTSQLRNAHFIWKWHVLSRTRNEIYQVSSQSNNAVEFNKVDCTLKQSEEIWRFLLLAVY